MRAVFLIVGFLVMVLGLWLLWEANSIDTLINVGVWLVAGVLLHDVVLATIVALAGWGIAQFVPPRIRGWVQGGLVVAGAITIMATPVLIGAGRKPDNPSLLPLNYPLNWLIVMVVIAVVTVLLGAFTGRRATAADTH
ncbi:MAG: hypothetical protein KDC39_15325 [Actinobacteria bacterium]|nr:hypothetical protein [Actinomycetota bacterium]